MAAIVDSRHAAAEIIRRDYPETMRAEALDALGDAVEAQDPASLFVARCGDACMDELAQRVAAPESQREEGELTIVKTVRGSELALFRGTDTWYGIVWNTDALSLERDRAKAELETAQANAETFAKREQLH